MDRENQSLTRHLFTPRHILHAMWLALYRLNPVALMMNPVMFIVWMGAVIVTVLTVYELIFPHSYPRHAHDIFFSMSLMIWLWITLWFANFSEALAEERGRAQAIALRGTRREILAKRIKSVDDVTSPELVLAENLKKGDLILIEPGDVIAADAEVIDGVASVDESAVTGESAPVIREPGGPNSAIVGGTRVLSDRLIARINVEPGDSFLDKMISMVDGARRRRTPNEVALTIMLIAMTVILLLSCATLVPFSLYASEMASRGAPVRVITVVAFLVCVVPTTIAGLLSTIGVAGMSRMLKANVIAMSGRAIEAAGDVDVLLLDKTGTITVGNREAIAFVPLQGVTVAELAAAAAAASIADETPEGYSILRKSATTCRSISIPSRARSLSRSAPRPACPGSISETVASVRVPCPRSAPGYGRKGWRFRKRLSRKRSAWAAAARPRLSSLKTAGFSVSWN